MPAGSPRLSPAATFGLRLVAWSLSLFGVLRLSWVQLHLVWPFTRVQATLAASMLGASRLPVDVTLACSGADALALCLGAILAYPARAGRRLQGAVGGLAFIVCLNVIRLVSLGRSIDSPAWFDALHLYIWPTILTVAIAGYVFAWTRVADRRAGHNGAVAPPAPAAPLPARMRRFVILTAIFTLIFVLSAPLYLDSTAVLAIASFITRAGATLLRFVGINALATANVLTTDRGPVVVTQECITTPLIPVYLAGVCVVATTWRRLAAGIAATVPLFAALGIARLLFVALPVVVSPLFLVHAFYQLLLGIVVVGLFGLWRHGPRAALPRVLAAVLAGAAFIVIAGPRYTQAIAHAAPIPADDPQGAIAFLPAFQIGLYLSLWIVSWAADAWPRVLAGLGILSLTQAGALSAAQIEAGRVSMAARVPYVRAWAVAGPLLVLLIMQSRVFRRAQPRQ